MGGWLQGQVESIDVEFPTNLPAHSPLGASGAGRWSICHGSVALSMGVDDEEDDTFSGPGRVAHKLADQCLRLNQHTWKAIGNSIKDPDTETQYKIDAEMAVPVQMYISSLEDTHKDFKIGHDALSEHSFYCPDLHPLFYGQADFVYVDLKKRELHVWDLKYGAGIVVEVQKNWQLMYYAVGVINSLGLWGDIDWVHLHVAQPRAWHWDGPIREWTLKTTTLENWLDDELLPAMNTTVISRQLASGQHCRFCPAKGRACPQLIEDMMELEEVLKSLEGETVEPLTPEQAGRLMDLFDLAKIMGKGVEQNVYHMINHGTRVPGRKLVNARANRIWKDEAEKEAIKKFGKSKCFSTPELLSPAQVEGQLPGGKAFATKYAFKPKTGLVVARDNDNRDAVNRDVKSLFKPVKKGRKK